MICFANVPRFIHDLPEWFEQVSSMNLKQKEGKNQVNILKLNKYTMVRRVFLNKILLLLFITCADSANKCDILIGQKDRTKT